MDQFNDLIFGEELSVGAWMAYMLLYGIGSMIYLLIKYKYRKDCSTTFSFSFWRKDNLPSLILAILFMYVGIRAYADIYPYIKDAAVLKYDLTQVGGTLLIGILNQKIALWFAKKLGIKSNTK